MKNFSGDSKFCPFRKQRECLRTIEKQAMVRLLKQKSLQAETEYMRAENKSFWF